MQIRYKYANLVTSMPLVNKRSRKLEVGRTSLLEHGM